ncbi:MAG: glutathione S-transferase [Alphaproteobacteria bacterium]|nr:glutathione S-transferase [Alphaproteobacteria bacterium]
MTFPADFPITKRWPPVNPEILQLYSRATPNGVKISIALEEMGLAYEPHLVDFSSQDQHSPEFLSLNPNNKIPAIIDPDGPNGAPLGLFESGAILLYLAEKTGKLLAADPATRYATIQWVMFQIGGMGPMFGQLDHFVRGAGKNIEDMRPRQRFVEEAERLLSVLDQHLDGREYLVGEFSIADIAVAPWLRIIMLSQELRDLVDWDDLENIPAYLERFLARPAVERGLKVLAD